MKVAQEFNKYPLGSLAQVGSLSLPLILSLFSGSLMGFCDRIFVGMISKEALEGLAIAVYLSLLLQVTCIRISSINQVFVASELGKGEARQGGVYTWQMIWFSLFSMALTLPVGFGMASFAFPNSLAGQLGKQYFMVIMSGNFLFPLGATLAAFFSGQGKTRLITYVTLISHLANITLNYLFIFGWDPVIPPLGVKGAAFATLASQGFFCAVLFSLFIGKKQLWGTREWAFQKNPFLESLRLGVPRALARFSALLAWNAAVYFITLKGRDYLLVLSIGSSLCLFISCINEGMGQGLITLFSYLKEKSYSMVLKGIKGGFLFLFCSFLIIGLPLVLFQKELIGLFLHEEVSPETFSYLRLGCLWVWLFFLFEGFAWIGLSLMTALGKTLYFLKMNLIINWPTIFTPMFLGIYLFEWSPDKIWLMCSLSCLTAGVICLYQGLTILRRSDEKSPVTAPQRLQYSGDSH